MEKKKTSFIGEFIKSLITSLVIVLVLTNFFIKPIRVNGSSMYPTLNDQSIGFSNILSFKMKGLERFDVVIVYVESLDEYLVKRVIALENESIQVVDDQLLINGSVVEQPFLNTDYVRSYQESIGNFTRDFDGYRCGDNQVFLMGDNRPYSSDSRVLGCFNLEDIVSKNAYILYPFYQFKWGVNP